MQPFLAQMSQVFPAEEDVNKHVEDNCKSALVPAACLIVFCAIHETFGNMCMFPHRFLDVPERRHFTEQRPDPLQQRSHLCTDLSSPF